MSKRIFCVDIGGSKLVCGVLTEQGDILETCRTDYPKNYTVNTVLEAIRRSYGELSHYDPVACGVAVPGLCDHETGMWLYSPFSGFGNIPITAILREMTGLPAFADNDVTVSALAERYFGLCKDIDDYLWITVSNGIGGGLFLGGKLYRGRNLSAGEIGHFIVEEEGRPCGCGSRGCLEAHASGASIAAIYAERTGVAASAADIAALARGKEPVARAVWQEAGGYLGKAISYAVNLLGIDTVVLGGGAAEAFDLLEPAIQTALQRYLFKKANPHVKVLHSEPGRFAALKGCAALVQEKGEGV